jgi:hypothetical protein
MWRADRHPAAKRAHLDAFALRPGYIPLAIGLRSLYSINRWDYYLDPPAMLAHELEKAEAVKAIGSDAIPCAVLRFDPVVLPSMFGGRVENVGGRPMVAPFLDGPREIERLRPPATESGIVPEVTKALHYFLDHTPEDVAVVTPPELDPFDAALLMCGSALFTLMNDEPDLAARLLDLVTDAFIRVQSLFKSLLDEPRREKVNYLGIAMPGIRVAADALVNLSPAAIARFCHPVFAKLAQAFGGVLVHYCPSPALRYYHVLKPVLECPHVLGVCTSGGVDYFDDGKNPLRLREGKTLVGECEIRCGGGPVTASASTNVNRFRSREAAGIPEWLRSDFMRLSLHGRRGLILRTAVSSVQEGRELYALWRRSVKEASDAGAEEFAWR